MAKAYQVISPVLLVEESLKSCLLEKGAPVKGQKKFDSNSVFGFIESTLAPQHSLKHLICDDLGNPEYADYIGIGERLINFYVAKGGGTVSGLIVKTKLSASAMHDAIAQVEKNLFYLKNGLNDWSKAKKKWGKKYGQSSKSKNSDISRVRTSGSSLEQIEKDYNVALGDTNKDLAFYVVVNFLSKKQIVDQLIRLRDGKSALPQVYQLVWMIAQTISLCSEQGVKFFLVCQE